MPSFFLILLRVSEVDLCFKVRLCYSRIFTSQQVLVTSLLVPIFPPLTNFIWCDQWSQCYLASSLLPVSPFAFPSPSITTLALSLKVVHPKCTYSFQSQLLSLAFTLRSTCQQSSSVTSTHPSCKPFSPPAPLFCHPCSVRWCRIACQWLQFPCLVPQSLLSLAPCGRQDTLRHLPGRYFTLSSFHLDLMALNPQLCNCKLFPLLT